MAEPDDRDDRPLLADARSIATRWREELDLGRLSAALLAQQGIEAMTLDVVALGKASLEMAAAVRQGRGTRVRRSLAVCDETSPRHGQANVEIVVGEHPVPGEGSLRAGQAVLSFLGQPSDAEATLFLISGGASSLCAVPAPPLSLDDLGAVWEAALRSGVDITTLNMIRAASSLLAGGAVLRRVGTAQSHSFVLVDNVVSGAPWVASAMTYDFQPSEARMIELWDRIGVVDAGLRGRLLEGFATRAALMGNVSTTRHQNAVLAEPAVMLQWARAEAERRGYRVIDLGAAITGDVNDVVAQWSSVIDAAPPGPVALMGVGEVTVKVHGGGQGGRCQEFAWLMADVLEKRAREGVFVARTSDGRDHLAGVAGAWVDRGTGAMARARGIDPLAVARSHDTYPALAALGRLIEGGHTGWNLCDLYVAVLA